MRHPLYLFGLMFLWFSPAMTVNQLVVTIVFTAYLFIGPLLEERRLEQEFGSAYREYRAKTPMMFPRIGGRAADAERGPAATPKVHERVFEVAPCARPREPLGIITG